MDFKIALKIGNVEFQYEGTRVDFENKFQAVFDSIAECGNGDVAPVVGQQNAADSSPAVKSFVPSMTVKSIAAKLGVSGGSDLVYAVVASLAVVKKKETFTRPEIIEEMKQAVGYYKSTHRSNLSAYLDVLIKKDTIIEVSKDVYALKEAARPEMEQKLA